MSQFDIMLDMLRSTQLQLRAADKTITAVLKLAEQPADSSAAVKKCVHPPSGRVPMATMGHATRFMCRACGQTLETINGEVVEAEG